MKDEFDRVIVDEFVGLKSKMYSIKKVDGKECNTAKGINIATEFNEFKGVLFNKKITLDFFYKQLRILSRARVA